MNKSLKYSLIIIALILLPLLLSLLSKYTNTLAIINNGYLNTVFSINDNTASSQTVTNPVINIYCNFSFAQDWNDVLESGWRPFIQLKKIEIRGGRPLENLTGRIYFNKLTGSINKQITLTNIGGNEIYCDVGMALPDYTHIIITDMIYVNYQYTPHAVIKCYNGDVYWYDNKGILNDLKESCNDGNACTIDSCNIDTCIHTPLTVITSYCSGYTFYNNGKCNPATGLTDYTIKECEPYCEGLTYYKYSLCDNTQGCQYIKINCNDNNACTQDICTINGCINEPIELDCPIKCENGIYYYMKGECNPLNGECVYLYNQTCTYGCSSEGTCLDEPLQITLTDTNKLFKILTIINIILGIIILIITVKLKIKH